MSIPWNDLEHRNTHFVQVDRLKEAEDENSRLRARVAELEAALTGLGWTLPATKTWLCTQGAGYCQHAQCRPVQSSAGAR